MILPILVGLGLVVTSGLAEAQPVYRTGVELVHFGVTVVDRKGTPVSGLTVDDFEVVERGTPQPVWYFAQGDADDARPLHLGLLFDCSGSMTEDLSFSRSAAIKFLNTQERAEDITLVDFDTEVRAARFGPRDFPRLVERLRSRKPDGWTALYDALGVYLDGSQDQTGQKVLVIYTDGGDTSSTMSFAEALSLIKASDVTVYAVGFLEHQPSSSRMEQRLRLQQLAESTGGQAIFPMSIKQLDEAYDKIFQELNARYTLGYVSTDRRADGAWREVEVRLTRPELKGAKVRTRRGYFAPYRPGSQP
ncbi:MAG: VWFA-related Acidobacterial domain protein [Acidobacteria bacterium]|nr:VWFA-related Acidobacterial domain protein [Acidobacteriota bacterium]